MIVELLLTVAELLLLMAKLLVMMLQHCKKHFGPLGGIHLALTGQTSSYKHDSATTTATISEVS